MSEISTPRALPPVSPSSRPNPVANELAVKLLQPLDGLMASGESAKAEVVGLKEVAQNFQLLLRLTLDSGRQATLTATSTRPLFEGTTLAVTALSDTRLAVSLLAGGDPALTRLDLSQLPSGTLLQAKVLSSELANPGTAGQAIYKVLANLLNTPLAGSKLALETPLALVPGSLLSARVDDSQALTFLPLSSRLGQLELSQQLGGQLARQGSLDGLFKALQGIGNQNGLPDGLRGSIDKLLGALPDAGQLSTAKGLGKALEDSGLLLEQKLLGGQSASLPTDLKANLLRLIGQLMPNLGSASPLAPGNLGGTLAQALPVFARNALGALGQGTPRQQALSFPLPSRLLADLEGEADLETLLKLAAAAVSRLQTHQLSSLAQTQVGPDGNLLTTWQLELPMRNQQELVPIQLKIQRDEPQESTKDEPREAFWRVELAFDLDPLGPLQVQVQLMRGNLSSQLWAERASTARLIDAELDNLRERFTSAGLTVSELACRQGVPPQGPRTTLEQRWVDETA
ncbi:MAG: flagellar hook-length control protein FliK [Gammaproteobacteria bacterium]|nr:flagellar hook-length control protein FliK [Gammaproteobacteria bacterium]MBU1490340.1 flagellar hook-length control protein FliK [Gammaproteobacteria bacterium]MBU2064661.1 flagellar hook-length control protein FliK [Gammaproteobacteria bacterium]MBU2138659.1 flagellar hook-length control protein FliK [Gammaproteobacteria bacterium]MBU2216993.1 flagellar hook-length control protein FliK [Gammaproteobacteria bacterium]